MDLCEALGGMTLSEMDAKMGANELWLWKARAQIEAFIQEQMRTRKVGRRAALMFARRDHQTVMERKQRRAAG